VGVRYVSSHIKSNSPYTSGCRPTNKEELFNFRHSSARNVIEQIFGVLKCHFRILLLAPEYSLEIQAWIPAALAAIHNFIRSHDSDNYEPHTANGDTIHDHSHDKPNPTFTCEEVDKWRDQIALAMWNNYQRVCEERGIGADESDEPDVGDDDEFDGLYEDL
jgi:hypothetical protein